MKPPSLKIHVRLTERGIKTKIFVLRPTTQRETLTLNVGGRIGSVVGLREFPIEYAIDDSRESFCLSLLQNPPLSVTIPWGLSEVWKRLALDDYLALEYRILEVQKN